MDALQASWDRTTGYLRDAEAELGHATHPALAECRRFLHHNELDLAMEALEAVGEALDAQPAFWSALKAAADEMRLAEHSDRYARRALTKRPAAGA